MCKLHLQRAECLSLNLYPCSVAVSGSGALIGFGKLPGDAAHSQLVSFMVTFRNTLKSTFFFFFFLRNREEIGYSTRLDAVLPSESN